MNIKISHNWLKEYLETKDSPKKIGEELSLSGPSVEKITKQGHDYIYDIEVTTNRVDCMSTLGIAREASVILKNSKLKPVKFRKIKGGNEDLLHISADPKLTKRIMAVVLEVEKKVTPKIIKERLESAGMRSLNPIVDITNYVMQEIGHPTHVFDFDKIKNAANVSNLIFRLSKKGEKVTTFDGKEYELQGDDIVVDNGNGTIIDLPGIIGLKNSVVGKDTKKIIFFINNNDPFKIRKTSTRLGIRTNAAIINEKAVDPELASLALNVGIELYQKICKAKIISKIYDIYPKKYKAKKITIIHSFLEKTIGIPLDTKKVVEILTKLGFGVNFDKKRSMYQVKVPSWRTNDVQIPEDLVEEVARIYGYQNLPSEIMSGKLPVPTLNPPFKFENKIKYILKSHGGAEVYTNSLVPQNYATQNALSLKNPLGNDTKYLRTSLKPSLVSAAKENSGIKEPFYLFEVANVYIPKTKNLPDEIMTLGIIFANFEFRCAKGIIESLKEELNIENSREINLEKHDGYYCFEISVDELRKSAKEFKTYEPIPKYPAQIEDITLSFPKETKIGEVMKVFKKSELVDNFENYFTFRVWYQDKNKTLNNKEVEKIREKYLREIRQKFGGVAKN